MWSGVQSAGQGPAGPAGPQPADSQTCESLARAVKSGPGQQRRPAESHAEDSDVLIVLYMAMAD